MSTAQQREAQKLVAGIENSVAVYRAFRNRFGHEGAEPLLPDCGDVEAAVAALSEELSAVNLRPRARTRGSFGVRAA